jgi:hypothetical protein
MKSIAVGFAAASLLIPSISHAWQQHSTQQMQPHSTQQMQPHPMQPHAMEPHPMQPHMHEGVHHFHDHDHDHFHSSFVFAGVLGAPVYAYPYYATPFYPAPYYPGTVWYWCAAPTGYYPYIPQCAVPWQAITGY